MYRATGASVVDMENSAARAWAAARGARFVGVRAVSDRADEALDPALLRLVDDRGAVRPARLAAELCRRPALLATLWRMRSGAALALENLGKSVGNIVAELAAEEPRT